MSKFIEVTDAEPFLRSKNAAAAAPARVRITAPQKHAFMKKPLSYFRKPEVISVPAHI